MTKRLCPQSKWEGEGKRGVEYDFSGSPGLGARGLERLCDRLGSSQPLRAGQEAHRFPPESVHLRHPSQMSVYDLTWVLGWM